MHIKPLQLSRQKDAEVFKQTCLSFLPICHQLLTYKMAYPNFKWK